MQDTAKCFDFTTQTITVGKEAAFLGDLYKICTQIVISAPNHPARIVLVIDNSGSMCRSATGIPASDSNALRILAANDFADSVYSRCKNCEIGVIIYKDDNTADEGALTVVGRLNPLNVGAAGNIALIHAAS